VRWLLILLILTSLALSSALAPVQPQAQLSARIQRAAAFYRNRDGFMGVLAVQRDHHVIYELFAKETKRLLSH
jgi:hypothetical protein